MCIFCKIVAGEIPTKKIYEDEKTLAFLNILNSYPGHTLVIPKKHCDNIYFADDETLAAVMATVQKVAKHYATLGFVGVNILSNNGKAAAQEVLHFHVHLVPREMQENAKGLFEYPEMSEPRDLVKEQEFFKLN